MKNINPVLSQLEISGFKSFATKKKFIFKSGITAIVGPNGSGKSNLADSIRWVFGEQKNKRLRTTKVEDLIFHGTTKKPQASMAEVNIKLDNQNSKIPIELSEIEINRKLYRSGESQYLINSKRIKTSELEAFLSKIGFGTQTYTVISQGTIESLVTATGVDKKLLFEEAAGIRHHIIARKNAISKLAQSSQNLEQVNILLQELTPNQSLLQKQANLAEKKDELSDNLNLARKNFLWNNKTELENELKSNQTELSKLKTQLQKLENNNLVGSAKNSSNKTNSITSQLQAKITTTQEKKEESLRELLLVENQLSDLTAQQSKLPSLVNAKKQFSNQQNEIEKHLVDLNTKKNKLESEVSQKDNKIEDFNTKILKLTDLLKLTNAQIENSQRNEYISHAISLSQTIRSQLRSQVTKAQIDNSLSKIYQILNKALADDTTNAALRLTSVQTQISSLMAAREEIIDSQNTIVINIRSTELDINSKNIELANVLSNMKHAVKEIKEIKSGEAKLSKLNTKLSKLKERIAESDKVISKSKLEIEKSLSQNQLLEETIDKIQQASDSRNGLQNNINQLLIRHDEIIDSLNNLKSSSLKWFNKPTISKPTQSIESDETTLLRIEAEINALEEIDPSIISRSATLNKRIEFLSSQQSDLKTAIRDTNKLIVRLKEEISNQFQTNFSQINKQFSKYFSILFPHGKASITLHQVEDNFEVAISATPHGKRSKNINALSGGEKALTSLALLSAIISSRPSPFLILDEVDASLDDENSTRFCKILTELATYSQIIVITHNHETMQVADHLIGITTNAKKETEVLQLSLAQADELVNTN